MDRTVTVSTKETQVPDGRALLEEYQGLEAAQKRGEIAAGFTTEWLAQLSRTELRAMLKELDEQPSVGRR